MRRRIGVVVSAFLVAFASESAADVNSLTISENFSDVTDLSSASRKIMRLSNGTIFGSFHFGDDAKQMGLFSYNSGTDSWSDVTGNNPLSSPIASVNSDTGPAGTFVSFVDKATGIGEIMLYPDAAEQPGKFLKFGGLTPPLPGLTDGYIAASKGEDSTNSVAYGWRDETGNTLLVGFAANSRDINKAEIVLEDQFLASGPSIAVHNNYVLVSYLTRSPELQPDHARGSELAFPAFIESWDGGVSWTSPAPVLGKSDAELPNANSIVIRDGDFDGLTGSVLAAGGASSVGNVLAWPAPKIGARIFVLTEQNLVLKNESGVSSLSDVSTRVGVLAFKDLSDGPNAAWRTVIASEPVSADQDGKLKLSDFQYSALPGSSVRAVAYHRDQNAGTFGDEELAVSISVNTGESFDRVVKFSKSDLGLSEKSPLIFTSSTCLFKDDDGEVYLDVAFADDEGSLKSARLPVGVNVADLPPSFFNAMVRWP